MLDSSSAELHPLTSFWLDVADKIIKFLAVLVGAAWTWINFRRSRTFAQKLELQLSGHVIAKEERYIRILAGLKNLGASKYSLQQRGTLCEVLAVQSDLSEVPVRLFSVFTANQWIEPGETITDGLQCSLTPFDQDKPVWLKIHLRVVSGKTEWNSTCLVDIA